MVKPLGYTHFNPASYLAPVGSPLVIELPAAVMQKLTGQAQSAVVFATRTGHISDRSQEMGYLLDNGQEIRGQFRWTHA